MEDDRQTPVTAALVAGLLAGYGIAIPVGAVGAYLVSVSARTSLRVGVCAALGIATADGVYALAAVLGGAALADAIEPVADPLRLASALVLVVLAGWGAAAAVRRWRAARSGTDVVGAEMLAGRMTTPLVSYLGFLGITVVNPTTVFYFAALVVGNQADLASGADATVFVVAAFTASASWQILLAAGGSVLGRFVAGDRGRLATAVVSSAVILALAGFLLLG